MAAEGYFLPGEDLRQRLALQMLSQQRAYPKNIGEGLSAIGHAIGQRAMMDELLKADAASIGNAETLAKKYAIPPATAPSAAVAPPAATPTPPAATPTAALTGDDRDAAIRTIVAEAGNQSPEGQNAVASVIRNRVLSGKYGGDTAGAVVRSPNQFEPWNTPAGRARMAAINPNGPQYAAAATALDNAYAGNDPTNGAVNFLNPALQRQLGRPIPAWAQGQGQAIGDHTFFGGRDPRTVVAQAVVAQQQQPAPDGRGPLPADQSVNPPVNPPVVAQQIAQAPKPQQIAPRVPYEMKEPVAPEPPKLQDANQQELDVADEIARASARGDKHTPARLAPILKYWQDKRAQVNSRLIEDWKSDLIEHRAKVKAYEDWQVNRPKREADEKKAVADAERAQIDARETQRLGGVSPEFFTKEISKSMETARTLPGSAAAIRAVRKTLDDGMFTGSTAEVELSLKKLMASSGFPVDPRIQPTEQFRSYMANITAAARQMLAGGANISDKDLEAAEKAAGGKITLEAGSIRQIMHHLENLNTQMAIAHQGKVGIFAGDDNPQRSKMVYGTFGLPMENIVPDAAIERIQTYAKDPAKRDEAIADFNKTFRTPGLAEIVLSRQR